MNVATYTLKRGRLILAAAVLTVFGISVASAQQPLTAEQKELLKERAQWEAAASKFQAEGKLADAVAAAEKMVALERRIYGDVHVEVALSLRWIMQLQNAREEFPAAQRAADEALAIRVRLHGEKHWQATDARLDRDHVALLAALAPRQREDLGQADDLTKQARAAQQSGDFAAGAKAAAQAAAIRRRVLGTHRSTASSLAWAAFFLEKSGAPADARQPYEESLAIWSKVLGDHPDTATALNNLGHLLKNLGDYRAARSHLERAVAMNLKVRGELDSETAASLSNLASLLSALGDDAKARPLYEKSVAVYRKVRGNQPETAVALSNLGNVLTNQADYVAANACFTEALDIQRRALGKHPQTAVTLNNLGSLLEKRGDFAGARRHFEEALEIQEALGKGNVYTATSLNNLGLLMRRQGKPQEARRFLDRALAIYTKARGERHLETAQVLVNLGTVLNDLGDYEAAKPFFDKALAVIKKERGDESLPVAGVLEELGRLYQAQGLYPQASDQFARALAIFKKEVGEEHAYTARSLTDIGLLLAAKGDYPAAKDYFERDLAIIRKVYGTQHPSAARSLNNLGGMLLSQGNYAAAQAYFAQAAAIFRKSKMDEHPDMALVLNNVAKIREEFNDADGARRDYEQALAILQKAYGNDEHPNAVLTLSNLGVMLLNHGHPDEAAKHLQRVLKIDRKIHGENHPATAAAYHNVAVVLSRTGDDAGALDCLEKALAIHRKALGPAHPRVAMSLANLAASLTRSGRPKAGLDALLEAMQLEQQNLHRNFQAASEATMFAALDQASGSQDGMLTMVAAAKDTGDVQSALTWTLRRKGLVFDTVLRLRQAQSLLGPSDPIQKKVERNRALQHLLYNAALNPPQGWSAAKLAEQRAEWQKEADALDAELNVALSRKFSGQFNDWQGVDADKVRARLPADAALVEFVRWHPYDFKANGNVPRWQAARYLAFVLTPGTDGPHMIDLGEARAIDQAIGQLREHFERAPDPNLSIKAYWPEAKAVHKVVFAPLQPALGKAKTVFLAADGLLNQVPFEALVDGQNKFLVESYRFAYQTSGRDLLRPATERAKGVVVFAGPDFDLDPLERKTRAEKLAFKTDQFALRGDPARETSGAKWKRLKGAAAEASDIRKILAGSAYGAIRTFENADALEEVLKALPAPRILHLATHGYYFDREPDAPEDLLRTDLGVKARIRKAGNPLLRSGIVLAGANTKKTAPGVDDGWVTAAEIGFLNLRGTELVVLSACQTGLGDVKTGEGVFGLRRAFLHAGARTLVTSLFEVPDDDTRILMTRFYGNLKAGRSKLDSLRDAQLQLIQDRERQEGEMPHPFYWAGFVLVGDPR
jgi:CHAT domain-containing protein/Tfp pilus assembly protein PilF